MTGEGLQTSSSLSFSAATASQEAEDAKLASVYFDDTEVLGKNQKLGLACALLEHGAWPLAKQLLDYMPDGYPVGASRRLARALANLVGYSIEPFYRSQCKHWRNDTPVDSNGSGTDAVGAQRQRDSWGKFTHPVEQVTSWSDFEQLLWPWLTYLGPYLALRHEVGVKMMRLMLVRLEGESGGMETDSKDAGEKDISNTIVDICDHCLVPGTSLLSSPNYNYVDELWAILQRFPYQQRYYIYGRWKNVHTLRCWDLAIQRSKVLGMTKYAIKRLAKETAKLIGRQLGKLCHTYPMVALDYMLDKVQDFQNFIGPVVESMRFLSALEFDVLACKLLTMVLEID